MTPIPLFLDGVYTLDGVELTGEQIKNAVIDSIILKDIKEGDSE